jgi:5-methylcytosine-specific restriction protein A
MAWSKESRQSRGYGAPWDKIRLRILKRDCGVCQPCKRDGRAMIGNEVDHIISKAKAAAMGWSQEQIDGDANLQTICGPCHKLKTKVERGFVPKVETGADGWPVEARKQGD